MNPTLTAITAILIFGGIAGHFNRYPGDWKIIVSAVKGRLSAFKNWCRDNGGLGLIVYGGSCGILVAVITWPWSY